MRLELPHASPSRRELFHLDFTGRNPKPKALKEEARKWKGEHGALQKQLMAAQAAKGEREAELQAQTEAAQQQQEMGDIILELRLLLPILSLVLLVSF